MNSVAMSFHQKYYFAMKAHIGIDAITELTHSVAAKRGSITKMEDIPMKALQLEFEKVKTSIRAKFEHPFHVYVIKKLFGYRKVRYKGLAKNQAQLFMLFTLCNLVLAGMSALCQWGECVLNLAW